MQNTRQRYLDKRSIQGPWQITGIKREDYSSAVVIPACDEERWLFRTLNSLAVNPQSHLDDTLILVIMNHPAEIERRIKIANRRTLEQFTSSPLRQKLQLGWVDACSDGRELAEGGVGSARKLGFDLALARLRTDIDPILISLDADTLVEPDYLEAITRHFSTSDTGAAVVPFAHRPADNEMEQQAIDHYELYLRCYLLGLTLADSPYAFHSIGSAIACRASAYIRCGGMNRRQGGEDFYFLQSLAKTSEVAQLTGTTVFPAARLSARVPFGTGPSLIKLIDHPDEKLFYPVPVFDILQHWLELVATSAGLTGNQLQAAAANQHPELGFFLHRKKLAETWDRLRCNQGQEQKLMRAFHTWFDGLKTQQLLKHLCRSDQGGMSSASNAVPQFFHRIGLAPSGSIGEDLVQLRKWQNSVKYTDK